MRQTVAVGVIKSVEKTDKSGGKGMWIRGSFIMRYIYIFFLSHEVRRESHEEEIANRCRIIVLWLLPPFPLLLFSSPPFIRHSYTRNVCYFVFTIAKSGGGPTADPRHLFHDVVERKYE
jgi:hypothetical protein